jgi:hypothetical protein
VRLIVSLSWLDICAIFFCLCRSTIKFHKFLIIKFLIVLYLEWNNHNPISCLQVRSCDSIDSISCLWLQWMWCNVVHSFEYKQLVYCSILVVCSIFIQPVWIWGGFAVEEEWRTQSMLFLNCREVVNVNYTLWNN